MNRARREFLQRNKHSSISEYLLNKKHSPVTHFKYYWANAKDRTLILQPFRDKVWTGEKLILSSDYDLAFFKRFYEAKRNVLVTLDEIKY